MSDSIRPNLTHMGIFVTDLPMMVKFYTTVFGLVITDRGEGKAFRNQLVFMSGDPRKHHQVVLASGRPPEATFSTVMQISFTLPSLGALRQLKERALANGALNMRGINHGNAWSIYFGDPEGNTIECYLDSPFYVPQPHGDPLDLSLSDEELMAQTEAACRRDPGFMTRAEWEAKMAREMSA